MSKFSGYRYLVFPDNWNERKIKHIVNYKKGKNPKENDLVFDGGKIYLSMDYLRGSNEQLSYVNNSIDYVSVEDGDILLLWDGSNAGEFVKGKKGVLSSTMAVVKLLRNDIDKIYLWFLAKSIEPFLRSFTVGMGIPHVNGDFFSNIVVAFPDLIMQQKVASFLDHKTSQIDKLIAEKEKLLKLLEEKRIALITQAVTKGLNPDVRMKPSGVDWLGDIPEHWEVIPLRYLAQKVQTGTTPPSIGEDFFEGGEIDWFTPGDFYIPDILLNEANKKVRKEAFSGGILKLYPENTVLLIGIGATLGKVGVCTKKCSSNQQINAIITNDRINSFFLAYYLLINQEIIRLYSNFTTLGILNQDRTKMISIILPSLAEQRSICEYILKKTEAIFILSENISIAIEKLKEYRASLITSAVTGKIDVRNYKPEEEHEEIH